MQSIGQSGPRPLTVSPREWHSFESHNEAVEDAACPASPANGILWQDHHDRCFSHTNQPELPNLKSLKLGVYFGGRPNSIN